MELQLADLPPSAAPRRLVLNSAMPTLALSHRADISSSRAFYLAPSLTDVYLSASLTLLLLRNLAIRGSTKRPLRAPKRGQFSSRRHAITRYDSLGSDSLCLDQHIALEILNDSRRPSFPSLDFHQLRLDTDELISESRLLVSDIEGGSDADL